MVGINLAVKNNDSNYTEERFLADKNFLKF